MSTDQDAIAACIHEAAHAVMARLCAFPVRSVAVETAQRGSDVGMLRTFRMVTGDTVGSYYYEVLQGVSGGVGQAVFRCTTDPTRSPQMPLPTRGLVEATLLLRSLRQRTDGTHHAQLAQELSGYISALWEEAVQHLRQPGAVGAAEQIASALIRRRLVSSSELERAMHRHLPTSAGLREPTSAFPQWYAHLTGMSQEELVCLRKADYAEIWDYYTRNP